MMMQPILWSQGKRNVPQSFLSKVTRNSLLFFIYKHFKSQLIFSFIFTSFLLELPVKIVKGLEPVKTTVNERIELECEVSEEGAQVKW